MIHPQLAFALFKALLDGPAHHGGLAHLRERHIARRIGEGKFGLSIRRLADKKPYRRVMREAIAGGIDKEAGHLGHDRPLGAFGQDYRFPAAFPRTSNISDGLRLGLTGGKLKPFGLSSSSGVRRKLHLGFFEKDLGMGTDIGKVVIVFW